MINILETVESTDICVCLIRIFIFMGKILNILKIVVPIIIVLIGSIDLIKAVVSNSIDEDMKKASQKLLKRFILGVCVFFVTAIVQLILSLAGSKMDNRCFNCVVDVNGNKCNKEKIDKCKRYGTTQPKDNTAAPKEDSTIQNDSQPTPVVPKEDSTIQNDSQPIPVTPAEDINLDIDINNGKQGVCLSGTSLFMQAYCPSRSYWESKDFFGCGEYPDLNAESYKSIEASLDSLSISKNTRVILYRGKNFTGDIILDEKGYMNIYNLAFKNPQEFSVIHTITNEIKNLKAKWKWSTVSLYNNNDLNDQNHYFQGSMKVICED